MSKEKKVNLEGISDLYSESLASHGTVAKGVGWGDEVSHNLRFDKLLQVLAGEGEEPFSVNDLGCGYGSLYQVLRARNFNVALFRGYEISQEMLAEANKAIGGEGVELVQGAVLDQPADYAFASGIFNVRLEHTEGDWKAYILETLNNMNAFSIKGFAFNLLTTHVDYREDHLFYGDPCEFFDHCVRSYSRHVALLHDYPLYEWTIVVRK